jgi:hypothetical protein
MNATVPQARLAAVLREQQDDARKLDEAIEAQLLNAMGYGEV